ncbi:MAG: 1-(5-phosphoribosyl)-5-[(5-phosphoribosylamino)methylideneamino]imidazole-4-carboxamide isomerase [Candidatus Omnitrophica bacterium]|nr:1-(5-phosphoribosyl)-5-[(5-phosphoribosylamino)methylideneamino]imidazole-4-carboxamide isomerase [Candidatus Omnitrophota bacterium]
MLIIPAIDLKGGKVVRLYRGEFDKVSVYSDDAVQIAREWRLKGAQRIHLVDLDGAESGELRNLSILKGVVEAVDVPVECGGGIRTRASVDQLFEMGARYVILSTAVFTDLDMVRESVEAYGDRVLVSIDTKEGLVKARGWQSSAPLKVETVANMLKGMGVETVIHTNCARDGTLEGLDFYEIRKFLELTRLKVIVAGGVATLDDLQQLKKYEGDGVVGAILGRALYEGRIDLGEAISRC